MALQRKDGRWVGSRLDRGRVYCVVINGNLKQRELTILFFISSSFVVVGLSSLCKVGTLGPEEGE